MASRTESGARVSDPLQPIPLFAMPLFATRLSGHDVHNPGLIAKILAHRERHPSGEVRSNRAGWHSGPAFQTSRDPAIAWLLGSAHRFATEALGPRYGHFQTARLHMGSYWASVLGRGAFHAPHHHLPQHWSGVYYVSVGEVGAGEGDFAGWIEFVNPNLQASSWGAGNSLHRPSEGLLLLFPSSLVHFVHPLASDTLRITVAFNLDVRRRAPPGDAGVEGGT